MDASFDWARYCLAPEKMSEGNRVQLLVDSQAYTAMLEAIETDALLICVASPYLSEAGNRSAMAYVSRTTRWASCQTRYFL